MITAAGNTTFRVEGVILFTVEVGGHKASTVLDDETKVAFKMMLGTAFIGRNISRNETLRRQIIQRSGHADANFESFEDNGTEEIEKRSVKKHNGTIKMSSTTCKGAKAKTVPQRREPPIIVCTVQAGAFIAEAMPTTCKRNRLKVARGTVKMISKRQFSMWLRIVQLCL